MTHSDRSASREVRLFRNNRNQAVRIPVEFELPGDRALIHREGDRLVIEPVRKAGLLGLLASWSPIEETLPEIGDPRRSAGRHSLTAYLLDTNILSDLVRNPSGQVVRHIERVGEDAVFTSIIVAAELRYGAAKKGSPALTGRIDALLSELRVLALDAPTDRRYGAARAELEAKGMTIGHNDLLIAAHGLALGATVVTANVSEFRRVDGLAVENWLEGSRWVATS